MRPALRLRRQPMLWAGTAILAVVVLMWQRPETEPPAPAPSAPMVTPPLAPPAPAPLLPLVPPAPAPVAASTDGLQLKGVLGYAGGRGAAIFALSDGRQRLVAVGREVVPGVRLEAIASDRATIHDGVQRHEFLLPELQTTSTAASASAPPIQAPVAVAPAPDPERDFASLRDAVKPEGDPSRPRGYRIGETAPLAVLERAGLRAGDLVLAINGQPIDEARLRELPTELLGAATVEIDYERAGRRRRAVVSTSD